MSPLPPRALHAQSLPRSLRQRHPVEPQQVRSGSHRAVPQDPAQSAARGQRKLYSATQRLRDRVGTTKQGGAADDL